MRPSTESEGASLINEMNRGRDKRKSFFLNKRALSGSEGGREGGVEKGSGRIGK